MEQKLNIAEILKNKPIGIKLYSSTFGYIKFNGVHKDKVYFYSEDTNAHSVKSNGKMYDSGECIIFPSKEMRDWSKFAWKRGDVLINNSGFKVLFDKWANDVYTGFYAKIDRLGNSTYYDTDRYTLAPEDEATSYIKIIEDKYKGKLNRETLKIERQHKFKPFDKVLCRDWDGGKWGADFFSHYDESSDYPFICIKGVYKQCIPYSDMTRHLLGITGEWKG